jgi:hypothetical protein
MTHRFDGFVQKQFSTLKRQIPSDFEIFIMAEEGTVVPEAFLKQTHFFDFSKIKSRASEYIGSSVVPGNMHLAALDFFEKTPQFKYYWFIEYDVFFTGNWADLFEFFSNDSTDLLCPRIKTVLEDLNWDWLHTIRMPSVIMPKENWKIGLFSIYRISNRGLHAVNRKVSEGWSGHFEGLLVNMIENSGFSFAQLGGNGTFTPLERKKLFLSQPNSGKPYFRFRPVISFIPFKKNILVHPVKHFWSLIFYNCFKVLGNKE